MKKLFLFLIMLVFLHSSAIAFELSDTDKSQLQSVEPVLEKMYIEDSNRFNSIFDRVHIILSKGKTHTRGYKLMSELKSMMSIVAGENYYRLVKVVDGDTVTLYDSSIGENINYRLIGIDAPETSALRFGEVEEYGKESTLYLQELLEGGNISVEYDESQGKIDQYERHLVYIFSDDTNVNQEMIAQGYAKEYTYDSEYKYQSEFQQAQQQAEQQGIGIWGIEESVNLNNSYSGNSDLESDGECTIKGNISSDDEKIYHYEGCQSYTKTKISVEKGERYFCTTKEAESAGWRVAGNCR